MPEKKQSKPKSKAKTKGGTVLTEAAKLSVPFGLIAAKNLLEDFIFKREKDLRKLKKRRPK